MCSINITNSKQEMTESNKNRQQKIKIYSVLPLWPEITTSRLRQDQYKDNLSQISKHAIKKCVLEKQ